MLNLEVLGIGQVLDMEELLNLLHAFLGQVDGLFLLIDDEVAGLLLLDAHDGVDSGVLGQVIAPMQLTGQHVAHLVEFRGLAGLAGNDERGPGLIDQDRVDLVNDAVMEVPLYEVLLIDRHIVPEVVESELIIRNISNVAVVGGLPLFLRHVVQYDADLEAQKFVDFSHPLGVTLGQVVVYRDDLDPLALQGIEVGRKGGHERLSFTGLHLGNPALMEDNATDQLDPEGLHADGSLCCLPDRRKGLGQEVIQRLALCQPLLEFRSLRRQFLVRKLLHIGPHRLNLVHNRGNPLQLVLTVRPEQLCHQTHVKISP